MRSVFIRNDHESFTIAGIELDAEEYEARWSWKAVEVVIEEERERLGEQYAAFSRGDFKRLGMLDPYIRYFKRFKKTYHLMLQLESFVQKGRGLPRIHPFVTAYYLAELRTGVLGSIHDADLVEGALRLAETGRDANARERVILFNGEERMAPAGDAALFDARGLLTCVTQGQDSRSMVTGETRRACVVAYGVPGVEPAVLEQHLASVEEFLGRFGFKKG
jgi:DNA/RNA-binding domain of Phe-tRNA-synthetase-like protein